jgi:hypothetical protein
VKPIHVKLVQFPADIGLHLDNIMEQPGSDQSMSVERNASPPCNSSVKFKLEIGFDDMSPSVRDGSAPHSGVHVDWNPRKRRITVKPMLRTTGRRNRRASAGSDGVDSGVAAGIFGDGPGESDGDLEGQEKGGTIRDEDMKEEDSAWERARPHIAEGWLRSGAVRVS